MSVPVSLDALAVQVREHGGVAYVVSTGSDGRPHTVSARIETVADGLRAEVGRTTAANAAERPDVTILWPPGPDPRYCLIVDARATVQAEPGEAGVLALAPTRAVQHRQADAPDDIESCLPVEGAQ